MIAKTNAIALRVAPYSKTSHVVTWLSEDTGRLATVVKGAVRPKSAFLGQYDVGYTCEVLFYERARNGLHVVKECSPLAVRRGLREDWCAFAAAAYVSDLVLRATFPTDVPQGEEALYRLTQEVLDGLDARDRNPLGLMVWFELRLLQMLGYAPRLERCVCCGAHLAQLSAGFDAAHGGALCGTCLPQPIPDHVVPLGPDLQSLLRQWSNPASGSLLRNTVLSRKQLLALQNLTGTMLAHSLEMDPECRDAAVKTLRHREGDKR